MGNSESKKAKGEKKDKKECKLDKKTSITSLPAAQASYQPGSGQITEQRMHRSQSFSYQVTTVRTVTQSSHVQVIPDTAPAIQRKFSIGTPSTSQSSGPSNSYFPKKYNTVSAATGSIYNSNKVNDNLSKSVNSFDALPSTTTGAYSRKLSVGSRYPPAPTKSPSYTTNTPSSLGKKTAFFGSSVPPRSPSYLTASSTTVPSTSRWPGIGSNQTDIQIIDEPGALKIDVKRTGEKHPLSQSHVPTYKTDGKNRGKAMIINNITFEGNNQLREGAKIDELNLNNLFTQIGIKVKRKQNLKKAEISNCLNGFAKNSNWKTNDICIVVMMSHGNGTLDSESVICGSDSKTMKISEVVKLFVESPSLYGKPKIFIFQCCRGNEGAVQHDVQLAYPKWEDVLLAFSTVRGFPSLRNTETGSYYIQAICKVLMTHACNTELTDMLIIVQEKLKELSRQQQTSSFENMGFKKCYLNP